MAVHRSDNIGAWTALRAARSGDRTAVVTADERLTYRDLDARVARVAGALTAAGVVPGDRVLVSLKNRVEFLELLFGVARIGAIFVPVNFRLQAPELAWVLDDCTPRLVVVQRDTQAVVDRALVEAGLTVDRLVVDGSDADYAAWREAADPERASRPISPDDPVSIVYTSGTTGPPKGAVLTHGSVHANVANYLADWDLRADDATVVVNPIFHVVLHILCVPLLYLGGKVVLLEEFSADEALRQAEREQVTVWFAVPTAWEAIFASPELERWDRSRLRFAGSGGAAPSRALMARFAELEIPYRQGYGLTETTSSATTMAPEEQAARTGSIGRPFFHVEARVVDDDDREVPPDERGELQLRGRNICAGYWRAPQETAKAFTVDGWFRTGDIARADADGFLWIVDRKKDLIISGGENIASIEVEQAVLTHPAVRQAAVVGVPDPRWGETPRAYVTVYDGHHLEESVLIAHCRERIAHYKCPTSVEIREELPMTATGKIAKHRLRGGAPIGLTSTSPGGRA